jgi:hypothetical protein
MHSFNDIDIAGTTAKVTFYGLMNASVSDWPTGAKQIVGSHDHAGCAESTLKSVAAVECLLK